MGTKVQNGRLELNIPFYENSGDKLVQIKDENNLDYASNDLLSSCINHTDIISGLSLKSYLNNLIITNGYFYEDDTLYMFDDSTHIEVLETEESNINQYDINGEVIGNLVNDNGIVSGFENGGYFLLPMSWHPQNTWEFGFKFSAKVVNIGQQIIGGVNRQEEGFEFGLTDAGKFRFWLGSKLKGYDIGNAIIGTATLQANTNYWVRMTFDGSKYVLYYSTNGIDYVQDAVVESSVKICKVSNSIGQDSFGHTSIWNGNIDLNHTYLKVDDKIIWKGLKPINEYTVYYLYDSNSFVYSDVEPSEKYKFIGKFRINGNNITYKNPSMDLAESYAHGFIIDEKYGSIGYRIYSDGWKEQWGNNANPVFPIAFEEIPTIYTNGATNVSKIGMTISAGYWNVCGY